MARKYTYQDVKELVEQTGSELISKEEDIVNEKGYVTTRTRIEVWCKNPTHKSRTTTLNTFLNGTKCKLCSVRMSDEKIKSVELPEGYELLSFEYVSHALQLTIKCPKGHVFKRFYSNLRSCKECPICNNRYTFEEVEQIVGEAGYTLLSQKEEVADDKNCVKVLTKIKVKCPNPKHEAYEVVWGEFVRKSRCKYCVVEKRKLTYQEVKKYLESFGYELLSTEYISNSDKILIRCPEGHEYEMVYASFQQGRRCKYCSGNVKMTYQEGVEFLQSYGYKMLTSEKDFDGASKPVLLQCPHNHKPYYQSITIFKCNHRCPMCNESKGERRIREALINSNVHFIPQKKFDNLLGVKNGLLSYDFYLPDYNILIEYQGEYHDGSALNQTAEGFKFQQEHDKRKREYAEYNNIRLLEIWYWDYDNIEEILNKELKL